MLSEYIRRADSVISVVDTDYIVGNSLNEVSIKFIGLRCGLTLSYTNTRVNAVKFIDSFLFHDWLIIWPHKSYGSFKITNSKAMHWMWCCSPSKDIKYFFSLLEVNELISRLPSILLLAVCGLIKTCIGICSAGSLIDLLFLFHCFFVLGGGGAVSLLICTYVYLYIFMYPW